MNRSCFVGLMLVTVIGWGFEVAFGQDAGGQKLSSTEIERFYKVSETLYRGAQPSSKGLIELKNLGVKTVVSLRTDDDEDQERLKGTALACESIPISWNPFRKPKDADVVKFLRVATESAKQPVFVHCRQGVDRTGLMVASYRIVVQGWTKDDAIKEMKSVGWHKRYKKFETYLREMDVESMKKQLAQK